MDGKRRINPQNPARKIRGRKPKKSALANNVAVVKAPASPESEDK